MTSRYLQNNFTNCINFLDYLEWWINHLQQESCIFLCIHVIDVSQKKKEHKNLLELHFSDTPKHINNNCFLWNIMTERLNLLLKSHMKLHCLPLINKQNTWINIISKHGYQKHSTSRCLPDTVQKWTIANKPDFPIYSQTGIVLPKGGFGLARGRRGLKTNLLGSSPPSNWLVSQLLRPTKTSIIFHI
jgi:hypothetical protein